MLSKCSTTELRPQPFSLVAAFFRLSKNEVFPFHHKERSPPPPPITWETIQPVLRGPLWAWGHMLGMDELQAAHYYRLGQVLAASCWGAAAGQGGIVSPGLWSVPAFWLSWCLTPSSPALTLWAGAVGLFYRLCHFGE